MCPLLGQLEIGFFSSFSVAAVYSTNEANKAGLKQSIILNVYGHKTYLGPMLSPGGRNWQLTSPNMIK